jgi:hypothetical protein
MNRTRTLLTAAWALTTLAVGPTMSFGQTANPPLPDPVLEGRPDLAKDAALELDPTFRSMSGGISLRPPAGGKMVRRGGVTDEVVRFTSEEDRWTLIVSRILLAEPVKFGTPEISDVNAPAVDHGFVGTIAAQMRNDTPGKLLRAEMVPINGFDGALLASKFTEAGKKQLIQQAIIRRTDKTYYILTYYSPLSQDDVETDPAANAALAMFTKVVDSVELLDQEAIALDQTERLFRTRALFVNWTPEKLQGSLVPEQWLRLLRDGKDIGYTYIVEEPANDLPRAGKVETSVTGKPSGVRIGIRSRTMPEAGFVIDAESWFWVRNDRNQEAFRNLVVSKSEGKPANYAIEAGTSVNRNRIVPVRVEQPGGVGDQIEKTRDERIELQVWSSSNLQQLPPITKEVPPYYLPQALVHLMPRLLPLRDGRTYLFATYVPETRQVMTRYVDVLPITNATLGGVEHTAIPVQERAGLEGSITLHYFTPEGKYLGSLNRDNKIEIIASDPATIQSIWKDAKLERPSAVDDSKR